MWLSGRIITEKEPNGSCYEELTKCNVML